MGFVRVREREVESSSSGMRAGQKREAPNLPRFKGPSKVGRRYSTRAQKEARESFDFDRAKSEAKRVFTRVVKNAEQNTRLPTQTHQNRNRRPTKCDEMFSLHCINLEPHTMRED
jgi:hypothetical protein